MLGEVLCSKHNSLRKPTDMIKLGAKWICKPHLPCSESHVPEVAPTASAPPVAEVTSEEPQSRKRGREEVSDSRKRTRVTDGDDIDSFGTSLFEDVAGSPTNDSLPLHRRLEGRAPLGANNLSGRTTSPVETGDSEPTSPPRNHYHYFEADDLHPSLLERPAEDEGPTEDDAGKPLVPSGVGNDTRGGEGEGSAPALKVSRIQPAEGTPSSTGATRVNTSSPIFSDGLRALTNNASDLGGDWVPEIRLISKPATLLVKSALKRLPVNDPRNGSLSPPVDRVAEMDSRASTSQKKKSLRWANEVRFIERTLDTEPRVARGILRTASMPTSLTPSTVGRGLGAPLGKGGDGKKSGADASPGGDAGKAKSNAKAEAAIDGKFRDGFRRFCFVSGEPTGMDQSTGKEEPKGIMDRSPPEWLMRLRKDGAATHRTVVSLPEGLSVG